MPLDRLPTIPPDAPKYGEEYKHFKGDHAFVLGTFTHTETGELLVGYVEHAKDRGYRASDPNFVRPLAMFTDIHPSGVKRFTKVDGT